MKYIHNTEVPPGTMVVRPVVTLTHKHDKKGRRVGYKVRCSYPGNRRIPELSLDPDVVSAYAPDRDAIRMVFSMSVTEKWEVYHIEIISAFIHVQYERLKPLYMRPFPQYDGTP